MKKWIHTLIILLIILSGCSNASTTAPKDGKLQVVTTFYPMYYFTKKIAGDTAHVRLLIPNGVEPHDWEPSARDMANIQDADIFVYNSRYFETWTNKVFQSIDKSHLKIVEAAKGIQLMADESDEKGYNLASSKDPHVWLSPVLAQKEIDTIAKVLEQKDPKHKADYEKNAIDIKSELADLNRVYQEKLKDAKNKEFVTQHAAFGYLARQYGLTQIAIAGLSPDVEPPLAKLTELAKLTKRKKIKIIYFEGLTSSKVAKTLANEIGAKTAVLNPLEGLTKDEQEHGLDYIGVMKKNLQALQKTIK